jgi:hypothetical protein
LRMHLAWHSKILLMRNRYQAGTEFNDTID